MGYISKDMSWLGMRVVTKYWGRTNIERLHSVVLSKTKKLQWPAGSKQMSNGRVHQSLVPKRQSWGDGRNVSRPTSQKERGSHENRVQHV